MRQTLCDKCGEVIHERFVPSASVMLPHHVDNDRECIFMDLCPECGAELTHLIKTFAGPRL